MKLLNHSISVGLCVCTIALLHACGTRRVPPVALPPQVPQTPVVTMQDAATMTIADDSGPSPVQNTPDAASADSGARASEPPAVTAPTVGFRCQTRMAENETPRSAVEAWLAMPTGAPQFIARTPEATGGCDYASTGGAVILEMLVWWAGQGDRFQLVRQGGNVVFRERTESEEVRAGRWRTIGRFAVPAGATVTGQTALLER